MYYSLTFSYERPETPLYFEFSNRTYRRKNIKNTWIDWHLVPTERPSIENPEVKTKTVEIPGMNGDLDLSESLTGYPTYKTRKGSIDFMIVTGYEYWNEIYQSMCSYFHGKKVYFACEDDPAYYYCARITVGKYDSQKDNSNITIEYEAEPYKYEYLDGRNPHNWDIFDFESDYIDGIKYSTNFADIELDSDEYVDICKGHDWGNYTEMPVIPKIIVRDIQFGTKLSIRFVNSEMNIDSERAISTAGTYIFPEMVMTQKRNCGKTTYDITTTISGHNPYKKRAVLYGVDMPYNENSYILQAAGHCSLDIVMITGRM